MCSHTCTSEATCSWVWYTMYTYFLAPAGIQTWFKPTTTCKLQRNWHPNHLAICGSVKQNNPSSRFEPSTDWLINNSRKCWLTLLYCSSMVGPTTPILCKTMLSPYVRAVHSLKVLLTLTKEPFVSATTSWENNICTYQTSNYHSAASFAQQE